MKLVYKPTGGTLVVPDGKDIDYLLKAGFEQVKAPKKAEPKEEEPAKEATEAPAKAPAKKRTTTKKTEA